MDYKIEIKEEAAQKVLSVRTVTSVGELPQKMGQAYGTIWKYIEEIGAKPGDVAFAAYYNEDMENLDVEMGFPVVSAVEGKGEIKAGEIPAVKLASLIHKGPYKDCVPAYEALKKWTEQNGYMTTGISYEFYLNDPAMVPESELLTRIAFPIK